MRNENHESIPMDFQMNDERLLNSRDEQQLPDSSQLRINTDPAAFGDQ